MFILFSDHKHRTPLRKRFSTFICYQIKYLSEIFHICERFLKWIVSKTAYVVINIY